MTNYPSYIVKFINKLDAQVNEMLDQMDQGAEYAEKYDIKLTVDNNEVVIPMNADSYCRLSTFLEQEIVEYMQLADSFDDMLLIANYQDWLIEQGRIEDTMFVMTHMLNVVHNPFKIYAFDGWINCSPIDSYGKSFLISSWTTEVPLFIKKVRETAINFCQWNDRNGIYTDEYRAAEGFGPLSFMEAVHHFMMSITENVDGFTYDMSQDIEMLMDKKLYYPAFDKLVKLTNTPDDEKVQAFKDLEVLR